MALAVHHDGRIVGIAPMHFGCRNRLSLEPRCLRPVGVLGQRHSDLTEEPVLLIEKGLQAEVVPVLLNALSELASDFDIVQLHYVADEPTTANRSRWSSLLTSGCWHNSTPMLSVALPETWEAFCAHLSSRSRDHFRRKPAALAKKCGKYTVELASPEQTHWAVNELIRLHRLRAENSRGRTVHIVSQEHRLFYQDFFCRMAVLGLGGIWILRTKDEVISAQSMLVGEREWLLLHSGHSDAYANLSPTVVLQIEVFRQAISQGAPKIRLHRFAQEWKMRMGAQIDGYFDQWIAMRRNPSTMVRAAFYAGSRSQRDIPEPAPPTTPTP
jgi:CelD/BcsL family acetyltransferase involved in cellulose biosynthesis